MSSFAMLWPMLACAVTGLALYVTRGVLDQTVTAGRVVRFAMLPPWQALVGFICLAALGLVVIDHLNAPRGTTRANRPRLRDLVLPLFALIVLLLPYLPVLPDRSEEHTSELQSQSKLVCRLLLEKKKNNA